MHPPLPLPMEPLLPLTCVYIPKPPTGVVGDRPIRPVSAQSCRACTISSACQLSIATGASPTQPKTVGPTNSKKKPIVHSGSRGGEATSTNEKPSTNTIAALSNQSVRRVGQKTGGAMALFGSQGTPPTAVGGHTLPTPCKLGSPWQVPNVLSHGVPRKLAARRPGLSPASAPRGRL